MTPFNQIFRLWLRRASVRERASAGFATVLAVVLLVWAMVPARWDEKDVAAIEPTPPTAQTSARPAVTAPAGEDATSTTTGPSQSQRDQSSGPSTDGGGAATTVPSTSRQQPSVPQAGCPSGTDKGVTDTEMHVAFTIYDAGGRTGNESFGLPSTGEQESYFDLVTERVNRDGGICGRRVVPHQYRIAALQPGAVHAACLEIVADEPFMVFDIGPAETESACFAKAQTPFFSMGSTSKDAQRYAPYVYAPTSHDIVYRNGILAWMRAGKFNDGGQLGKIGVAYRSSCVKVFEDAMFAALREAGIPDDRLSIFDFGDCNAPASPSTHQQAILQFKRDGVTHVLVGVGMILDFGTFTRIAEQQRFKPKYRIIDQGTLLVSYGSLGPVWSNIDGASAMTLFRFGEERTPNYPPHDATRRCDEIFADAGRPPVYQQPMGFGGMACMFLWSLKTAVEHAPEMTRIGIAHGLGTAGTVRDPYPFGPTSFAPGELFAGRQWREITASAGCRCFQVLDRAFNPSFP